MKQLLSTDAFKVFNYNVISFPLDITYTEHLEDTKNLSLQRKKFKGRCIRIFLSESIQTLQTINNQL
eukprot:snap_masked-scaffold_56-processed-gene-0.19-mRNA-1 protein AED:1.00 eAED:1.00 QI:0/0/0/0/1/1/2/0/66